MEIKCQLDATEVLIADIIACSTCFGASLCPSSGGEKLTGSAASQEIPRILWNPEVSSPYSQVPATCPYPEPTPSSPHNLLPLPEDPS